MCCPPVGREKNALRGLIAERKADTVGMPRELAPHGEYKRAWGRGAAMAGKKKGERMCGA